MLEIILSSRDIALRQTEKIVLALLFTKMHL